MNNIRALACFGAMFALAACSSDPPADTVAGGTAGAAVSSGAGATGGAGGSAGVGSSSASGSVGSAGTTGSGAGNGAATGPGGMGGSGTGTSGAGGAGGADPSGTGSGGSPEGGAAGSGNADAASADGASGAWPRIDDYAAPGPLMVRHDVNTGPGAVYDVFRPTVLGGDARKHPIISWANGTLFGIPDYQKLLEHWASHGFVVIAAQSRSTGGGATHKAGIDWLVAENGRAGSPFAGALDTKAIGAAGHSQGGGATIAAGSNKPAAAGIVATLPLMPILSFETDKTIVSRQTAPMLNINATMDDRDPTGAIAKQIYDGANRELVQAAFIGIHEDAMAAAMHGPTLAWFRLHLMGDDRAKALFYPATTCGLCRNTAWREVRYKNTP